MLSGKTAVITGANSGLGRETAVALADMGATLVLICRNPEKAAALERRLAGTGGHVEVLVADLLLQGEVRRLAKQISERHPKIDVLVNNAGTNYISYAQTKDGVERTIAVNYFAPFLLTNLLLEGLKAGAPSRVVNVASSAHYSGKLDPEKIATDRSMGVGGLGAYGRSKLALVLFTYELARRLEGSGVTVNCLHPGAVRTNIWSHAGPLSPFTRLASLFMLSSAEGADTQVYLSSSPEVEGVTGKYFEKRKEKKSSRTSYDRELASRLWTASEKLTGLDAGETAVQRT